MRVHRGEVEQRVAGTLSSDRDFVLSLRDFDIPSSDVSLYPILREDGI